MTVSQVPVESVPGRHSGRSEPFGRFALLEGIVTAILVYWWYHLDKSEHAFRAGAIQNIGVLVLTVVAIPVYLVRSRGWKRGAISIGLALAFILSVSAASMLVEHFMAGVPYG